MLPKGLRASTATTAGNSFAASLATGNSCSFCPFPITSQGVNPWLLRQHCFIFIHLHPISRVTCLVNGIAWGLGGFATQACFVATSMPSKRTSFWASPDCKAKLVTMASAQRVATFGKSMLPTWLPMESKNRWLMVTSFHMSWQGRQWTSWMKLQLFKYEGTQWNSQQNQKHYGARE